MAVLIHPFPPPRWKNGVADPGNLQVEFAEGEVELTGVEAVCLGSQETGPFQLHDLLEEGEARVFPFGHAACYPASR